MLERWRSSLGKDTMYQDGKNCSTANQLTFKKGQYPGLPRWAQYKYIKSLKVEEGGGKEGQRRSK